ncbi:MAG: thioredoxin family protein [Chitinophagales bacterium]
MKYLFVFFCFFFSLNLNAQEQAQWLTNIETATSQSKTQNKFILISFSGSDWCLPCAQLERDLFSTTTFANFAIDNLILLKADFPVRKKNQLSEEQQQRNEALAEKYNPNGTFPEMVIIDYNGKIIGYVAHPKASAEAYIRSIGELILPN